VVHAINAQAYDWAMPATHSVVAFADWTRALADVAAAVAQEKGVPAPAAQGTVTGEALAIARALLQGERKAVLLGNAAAHHIQASSLLALAQWIAQQTGASCGYLTEAANTVGAQFVGAQPLQGGLNAGRMLAGELKAALLLNTEPEFDSAAGAEAALALGQTDMVVTLSPFKANLAFSDVLLPIAPFTETSGSFANAEGRVQSFHAVVKPLGDARPAWKVLRVLGNLLGVQGMDYEASQDVLAKAVGKNVSQLPAERLSNTTQAPMAVFQGPSAAPVAASIYQLDSLVRRAPALQHTADARMAREGAAA
jgi:NADH-quinone oxidoreductase subunit G